MLDITIAKRCRLIELANRFQLNDEYCCLRVERVLVVPLYQRASLTVEEMPMIYVKSQQTTLATSEHANPDVNVS